MASADTKPVEINEFTAKGFLQPGEQILCAVIMGPDLDDPGETVLHMRSYLPAVQWLRALPRETRLMIIDHQERLLREFRAILEVQ